MEVDGVAKQDYCEGRRPVLPVRHVLHDEVSVRSAASVERRLPARHAAREGDEVQEGRSHSATACSPPPIATASSPRSRSSRRPSTPSTRFKPARAAMQAVLGVHKDRELPPYAPRKFRSRQPKQAISRCSDGKNTPGKVAIFSTCYVNYNEPGMGHDLLALLEHNEIPYVARREGSVLRHAEARARRPGIRRRAEEEEHAGARQLCARGLRDPHAGPLLHADVQAGAAAHVPGRRGHEARCAMRCSIRSSTS